MKEERAKELYEEYIEDGTPFDEFYKKIKKSKTSQVNFLEELMNMGAVSKDEFVDNICNVDEFLNILSLPYKIELFLLKLQHYIDPLYEYDFQQ